MAADDDKGGGPDSPLHVGTGATPSSERTPQSEWTASDRRGPLDSANGDGVERVVPAHEIDAVGDADGGVPRDVEPAAQAAQEGAATELPGVAVNGEPTPAAADVPRRSLLPVAAGLVVGAVVGAGSAWLVYAQDHGGAGDGQQLAALSARVDALDKRPDPGPDLAKLRGGLADVQGKVAALDKGAATRVAAAGQRGPSPAEPDAALAAKVAALQATVEGLHERAVPAAAGSGNAAETIAALQSSVAAARKQAGDAQAALNAFKGEQAQLGARLEALGTTVSGTLAKAEGAQKQAAEARSGLEAVQGRQTKLEGKLGSPALAVVADSLVEQIRAGQPFERQVDALAAMGTDPAKVALLRERAGGVASAQTLLAEWKPLENAVIATGSKAPADAGFGQRLEHGLFGLVSVRRADGTVGDDLAARVTAIGSDLAHGDIAAASTKWQALPPDAKARSDAWGGKLGSAATTMALARELQRAAIDALGRKS